MANREPRHVGTSCFGRAGAFVRDRGWSTTSGGDVAADAPGELLVRSAGADPRRGFFSGYLKDEAATERGLGRRLVPHRRPGAARRRRQLLLRRPQEERDPPQRREHLGGRGGERAEPASGGAGLRRSPPRPTRCAATRCWPASCCASRSRRRARRRWRPSIVAACAGAARLLQGAGLRRLRRRAAAHAIAEDPARRSCASWRVSCRARRIASTRARMKKQAAHDDAAAVLRRRRGRRAGHRALRALLDAQRALVHRPGARRRW